MQPRSPLLVSLFCAYPSCLRPRHLVPRDPSLGSTSSLPNSVPTKKQPLLLPAAAVVVLAEGFKRAEAFCRLPLKTSVTSGSMGLLRRRRRSKEAGTGVPRGVAATAGKVRRTRGGLIHPILAYRGLVACLAIPPLLVRLVLVAAVLTVKGLHCRSLIRVALFHY